MRVRYLPDRPLAPDDPDLLSFEAAAETALGHLAASEPPFTWGIFGDWGSGKTSLMRLIAKKMEARLREPPKDPTIAVHIPVWFDAWRYENEVNIVYPMFHAIRRDFERRCPTAKDDQSFGQSFTKVATASLLGLSDLALRAVTNKAFGEAMTIEDVANHLKTAEKELETVFDTWSDTIEAMTDDFDAFVNSYLTVYRKLQPQLGERPIYLAIFVDDLDRCLPDVAITILERIKNHLSAGSCIFVLGVNRHVLYQSIRKKYQDLDIDGRQHLEKIIQYSLGVPEPSEAQLVGFIVKSIQGLLPEARDDGDLLYYFQQFAKALYDCRFTNPRKIKRILNRYLAFLEQHQAEGDLEQYHIATVARLIVTREYYHAFYDLFSELEFAPFEKIAGYGGRETEEKEFLEAYGAKWKPLIASFEHFKKIAAFEPGLDKTPDDYDRAIRVLFGKED